MEIISSISVLRETLQGRQPVAFVPTMGNLHEGHIALVEQARRHGRSVVVSIFVNPLQFGAGEDLANYPRTLEQDCRKLQAAGADIVFTPSAQELFPTPQQFQVEPPPIASELCGAFRPGHFRGVATIVLKLFNIVQPACAVFGKKDYQQLFIIRGMVREFDLPLEIVAGETVRAEDGLALSSRNGYLTPEERTEAPRLYRNLRADQGSGGNGPTRFRCAGKYRHRRPRQPRLAGGLHLTAQRRYPATRASRRRLPGRTGCRPAGRDTADRQSRIQPHLNALI